jgi:tetratricopeptide (TPR) repeat protein
MKGNGWRTLAGIVMLSTTVSGLVFMAAPALAQALKDWKCTGDTDIPWAEQVVGCSNAIDSEKLTGEHLAAAFNNRGGAYGATGDLDHALTDFNQAISVDPNAAFAYQGRANLFFFKKDYDHAITDYNEAIRLDPKFARAFNGRGNGYQAKGDLDRAIADFDRLSGSIPITPLPSATAAMPT